MMVLPSSRPSFSFLLSILPCFTPSFLLRPHPLPTPLPLPFFCASTLLYVLPFSLSSLASFPLLLYPLFVLPSPFICSSFFIPSPFLPLPSIAFPSFVSYFVPSVPCPSFSLHSFAFPSFIPLLFFRPSLFIPAPGVLNSTITRSTRTHMFMHI